MVRVLMVQGKAIWKELDEVKNVKFMHAGVEGDDEDCCSITINERQTERNKEQADRTEMPQ
jgi:hypothetical protein